MNLRKKTFFKFIKYAGSTSYKTRNLLLIHFDVITSSNVDSFVTTLGSKIIDGNVVSKLRTSDVSQIEYIRFQTTKSETIFMESARRINDLFSTVGNSALFLCYIAFGNSARLRPSGFVVETTIADSENLKEKLANTPREHTLCF